MKLNWKLNPCPSSRSCEQLAAIPRIDPGSGQAGGLSGDDHGSVGESRQGPRGPDPRGLPGQFHAHGARRIPVGDQFRRRAYNEPAVPIDLRARLRPGEGACFRAGPLPRGGEQAGRVRDRHPWRWPR